MDISSLSMAMATSKIQTDVSVALLGKSLDMTETAGASLEKMIDSSAMEQSVEPNLGQSIDLRV